jgi:hypothetical protein
MMVAGGGGRFAIALRGRAAKLRVRLFDKSSVAEPTLRVCPRERHALGLDPRVATGLPSGKRGTRLR